MVLLAIKNPSNNVFGYAVAYDLALISEGQRFESRHFGRLIVLWEINSAATIRYLQNRFDSAQNIAIFDTK